MRYLNADLLRDLDPASFRGADPYPWLSVEQLVTDEGFERLRQALPETSRMEGFFGVQRAHGQTSHDRYVLEWEDELDVDPAWGEFVEELRGEGYGRFLRRMLGTRLFSLRFHWHYAPRDCSVSPHCDNRAKLGSHIFYFNADDWEPDWGGQTLVLDDHGRFQRRSAPAFDDFDREIAAPAVGNQSFLFARGANSWHGVRPLRCPEGRMRRVFIVVIDRNGPVQRVRRLVRMGAR